MSMINLGGEEFINAEETVAGGFREVQTGGIVFDIIAVNQRLAPKGFKTPGAPMLEFVFDVSEGVNKGIYAELQEKFGGNLPEGMTKHLTSLFTLDSEGFGRIKGFLNRAATDPANPTGPAVAASLAAGQIDDSLIVGLKVGAFVDWVERNGYWNEKIKYHLTVEEARAKGISKKGKPENTAKPAASNDDDGDWN